MGTDIYQWIKKAFKNALKNTNRKRIVSFRFASLENKCVTGYVLLEPKDSQMLDVKEALKNLAAISNFSIKLEVPDETFPNIKQASFIYQKGEWNLAWWTDGNQIFLTDWLDRQNISVSDFTVDLDSNK